MEIKAKGQIFLGFCFIITVMFLGLVAHETTHWIEFKAQGYDPSAICFAGYAELNGGSGIGYVLFLKTTNEEIKLGETNATIAQYVTMIVFLFIGYWSVTNKEELKK